MLVTLRKGWSATRHFIQFWTLDLIRDFRKARHTRAICPFDQVPLENLPNGGYGCPKCGGTESMPELVEPKASQAEKPSIARAPAVE